MDDEQGELRVRLSCIRLTFREQNVASYLVVPTYHSFVLPPSQ
jgi:hypothetical protein